MLCVKQLFTCLVILFAVSCQNLDKDVKEVLNNTPAERRVVFSNFIMHYSDRDMRENAKYLVANLLNKYSVIGDNNVIYQSYIDSVSDYHVLNNWNISDGKKGTALGKTSSYKLADIRQVQTDSLICFLDSTCQIWERTPWKSLYPKEIFRKYILPYRVADEPLEYGWKSDAYLRNQCYLHVCKDSSIVTACSYIYQHIGFQTDKLFWGEPLQSYSDDVRYKRGTCSDAATYTTMVMRALGIPTALDFVPMWGDGNNGHSFNALILPDGTSKGYDDKEDLLFGLKLSGKVPKIYRREFEVQRNTPLYKYKDAEYIPTLFAGHDVADVTDSYDLPITNVVIRPTLSIPQSHLVYLAVFSPIGWQPVAWGEYKREQVKFFNIGTGYISGESSKSKGESLGNGILFLPICYTAQREQQPLTYPIVLQLNGNIRTLFPDTNAVGDINITRKYPRKKRIVGFAEEMMDGYFELANKPDFSDAQVIYMVDKIPKSHLQTISLPQGKKYRYLRFYKRKGGISIAEMGCLDDAGKVVRGKMIADEMILDGRALESINDGNVLSYFDAKGMNDIWIGIDYGKPVSLHSLFFCPRTDDNDVSPKDTYELFYWHKKWISLGKQVANGYSLTYSNVPKNALLWLRDLTKGHEERPFTYEKGKQIWW